MLTMNADALRLMLFAASSNLKRSHYRPPSHNLRPHLRRCPPCKRFSPVLIDFYNACKDDMEVVFVSSDRDDKSFGDYFAKMPWLAMVPAYTSVEQSARQKKLGDMFKIQVR